MQQLQGRERATERRNQSSSEFVYPDAKASPAVQMRFYLARSRRHETPFERAWEFAFRRVRWPHDTQHRVQWKVAIEWSKEAWRNSYEGVPDHVEHFTSALDPEAV